jgi:hypothetical protein
MASTLSRTSKAEGGAVRVVLFLLVNKALDVLEIGDMTRNGNGALVLKSIFFLGFLEKFPEKRMVYIHHRYYKTLPFFPFTAHVHGHAALGNVQLVKIARLLL